MKNTIQFLIALCLIIGCKNKAGNISIGLIQLTYAQEKSFADHWEYVVDMEDGIVFDTYEKGFHRINDYTQVDMSKVTVHYGPKDRDYANFERPQMLLIKGRPAYLYLPSGTNVFGGPSTVSYSLKFKE